MYQRIVVPLDGSEFAERALTEAERLARLTGAPVHLVRVTDVTQLIWYGEFGMAMDLSAAEAETARETAAAGAYLETVAERLVGSGLVADTEVRRGQTYREVIAATRPGDVVVMASHGRGGMTRWFLGSVAEEVLRHATVPVLMVRATEASTSRQGTSSPTAAVS